MESVSLPKQIVDDNNNNKEEAISQVMELVGTKKNTVTFAEATQSTDASQDVSQSQTCRSAYSQSLSQPAKGLSHRQRMLWLQQRRETGLWVNCDACFRWRFLPHILDSHELPAMWYCKMNPDKSAADCSVPEAALQIREEEDLIHSSYSAGSVVWARLAGWPWWPAMVDDCVDTDQYYWLDGFSDIPTHYNVVFFDASEATRAWISPDNLMPYKYNKNKFANSLKDKKYKTRLQAAVKQADDADSLPLTNRLKKYSFLNRYPGKINSPKKISKKDLTKFQNKLKRKFNIVFEASSDSDDQALNTVERSNIIKNNVHILGTPKTSKAKKSDAPNNNEAPDSNTNENAKAGKKSRTKKGNVNARKAKISFAANKNTEQTCEDVETTKDNTTDEIKTNIGAAADEANKESSSMVVQLNTTAATFAGDVEMPYDDDTSKTYVPDTSTQETQNTVPFSNEPSTQSTMHVRVPSPTSDDFDF